MMPRLTIVLGAGGVGKTTLASGLGLALANAGAHAAVLGVDPARRLRSALGLAELPEHGVAVVRDRPGSLSAAALDPSACLRRWVAEACPDSAERAHLLASPYFVAIADRLAGFTDAIGCARAVEWAELDRTLSDIVLDTAPGLPAVELLARPDKLLALFDGRLVRWLVRLARLGTARHHGLLAGLAELSGADTLRELGALTSGLHGAIATMVARLQRARAWLRDPATSIVIVCGNSDDAADAAIALDRAVRALGFAPALIVANRVLPDALATWSPAAASEPARAFVRYVHGHMRLQEHVHARLAECRAPIAAVPEAAALDAPDRLAALAALGEHLRRALG